MKYFRFLIASSFADFRRNKVRTVLTSLGILIGVFSVVAMISLGLGLKNYIENQFEDLGSNLIIIFPGSGLSGGAASFGPGLAGGAEFDEKDIITLQKINEIDYVVPVFMKSSTIEGNNETKGGYVFGVNEDMFPLSNLEPLEGDILTKSDIQKRGKEVVLGETIATNLFEDPKRAVGDFVRVANQRYKIIGVIKKKGDNELDNGVFMSYKTTYGNLNPDRTFFAIYMGVDDEDNVTLAKEKAEEALLRRYEEDDFSVSEQAEILSTINDIFAIINIFLIALGSISLLVGGIGIMNIMYASVTERTKEIGIRRAIGATKRDILLQFLSQSILLSLIGGIIGLGLAWLIVILIHSVFPAEVNATAVAIGLGISTGIGVFFGVFPARRAANLSPIDAIRYE